MNMYFMGSKMPRSACYINLRKPLKHYFEPYEMCSGFKNDNISVVQNLDSLSSALGYVIC